MGALQFRSGIHYRVLSTTVFATSGQDVVEPPFSGGCLQISAIMRLYRLASRVLRLLRLAKTVKSHKGYSVMEKRDVRLSERIVLRKCCLFNSSAARKDEIRRRVIGSVDRSNNI